MKLGIGNTLIQLCDADTGIMEYEYTLDGTILNGLVQVQHPEKLDTEGIEEMDIGDLKKIVYGKRIKITIPIKNIENITVAAWETFLYQLWDWEGKIRITPHIDEVGYIYWVILDKGRMSEVDIRYLRELDVLEFSGAEIINSVS